MRFQLSIWVAIALCGTFMISAGARQSETPAHQVHTKKKKGKAPKALARKLETVRKNREKVKAQLRATNRQVKKVRVDLNVVDDQLDHLERKLDETTSQLEQDRERQKELSKLLAEDQKQLGKQTADVRRRIRQMYMQGNAPAISVLIGSSSSGDLASRAYFVERVMQADGHALKAYKDLVERIASQKAEADTIVHRIRTKEQEQREQQGELKDVRQEKRETLEDLESRRDELQRVQNQLDQDEEAVQRQILAAMAKGGGASSPRKFTGRLLRPVNGPLGSRFQPARMHPILHYIRKHDGQDFPAPHGTPIVAAANGTVVGAQYMRGFGNCVIIDHGGGIATLYAHCSRILVGVGQHVTRGEEIAKVGATGLATGPHLHFEVHVNGKAVDPLGWL